MSEAIPPSPASFAGSDWSNGPRGYPGKVNSPGPGSGGGRAGLPTPPVSGSSNGSAMNGMQGPGPGGPGGPPYNGMPGPPPRGDSRGAPSPPQSLGRLSTSSNLSIRDPEAAKRRQMLMEESLQQHYHILKQYLIQDLRRDAEGKSKRARDKLLRLSPIQFHELSTDIYDELRRRQNQHRAPPGAPNFLIPKENFHPKRNQARQKLSTLPDTRFKDLATDVFFELERRFPRFAGRPPPPGQRNGSPLNGMGPPSRSGTPSQGFRGHSPRQDSLASQIMSPGPDGFAAQKSTRGDMIVPNKSYLVEDDDDGDMDSLYGGGRRDTSATGRSFAQGKIVEEYQSKIDDLQGRVDLLERQVQEKDEEIERTRSDPSVGEEAEELRRSLEEKLSSAQELNRNLQEEIDNARAEQDQLQNQIEELSQRDSETHTLRSDHEELQSTHDSLLVVHQDLQKQHDSLQRQLQESSGGGEWRARAEDLEGENQELKRSFEEQRRVTQEVRSEAAGFLAEMRQIMEQSDSSHRREEQMVQRQSLLEAELKEYKDRYAKAKAQLSSGRRASMGLNNQQPSFGQNMRSPHGAIRDSDISKFQLGIDDVLRTARAGDAKEVLDRMTLVVSAVRPMVQSISNTNDPKVVKLRNRLTATVNNFITAGKNHAQSGGISPVSLLDAAASHVSAAIVELANFVKIRPAGDKEDDDVSYTAPTPAPAPASQPRVQQQAPPTPQPQQPPAALLSSAVYQRPGAPDVQQDLSQLSDDEDSDDPTSGYYGTGASTPASPKSIPARKPVGSAPAVPESLGELLPSTTYQLPSTTYQPPARKPVGGAAPAPVREQEPEHDSAPVANGQPSGPEPSLDDLKYFLDEQTSMLITRIQGLVTTIRGSQTEEEVADKLKLIIDTSTGILRHNENLLSQSRNQALQSQAGPLVVTLKNSCGKLEKKAKERPKGLSIEETAWKKWCQSVPPIAFEIARLVKDLGAKVRAVAEQDGGEDFS